MNIFFIRHGESKDGAKHVSQRNDSPLSGIGEHQLKKKTHFFKEKNLAGVYCSPYARTRQTAALLFPDASVEELDFIFEIKRPRFLDGGAHANAVWFWEIEHRSDKYQADWSFDGSESFNEVVIRVKRFLVFLEERHGDDEDIAVVTHGGFIRHFLGYAALADKYQPAIFFNLLFGLTIKNGDIVKVTYDLHSRGLKSWEIE